MLENEQPTARVITLTAYLEEIPDPTAISPTQHLYLEFTAPGGLVSSELAAVLEAVTCAYWTLSVELSGFDWLTPSLVTFGDCAESCHTALPDMVAEELKQLIDRAGLDFTVLLYGIELAA